MRLPRQLLVAGLTVVTVGSLSSSLLPGDGARAKPNYESQYGQSSRSVNATARLRATTLQDSINADELRSAELRAPEAEAAAIDQLLLEKER